MFKFQYLRPLLLWDYKRFLPEWLMSILSKEGNVKVKCTLVQSLRLCTGRTAHRWSRGITLPLHDHGTRWGWGVSVTPRPLFTSEKEPVPIVQEAGWAPGPVWTGAEITPLPGLKSVVVSYLRVEISIRRDMEISIVEDVSSSLHRNVGHQSTSYATPHPRTTQTSTAELRRSKNRINPSIYTQIINREFFSLNVVKCYTDWQAVV